MGILTIAPMGSLIGRQGGALLRRCGAVLIMAKDAAAGAAHLWEPPPLNMIAMRASPIGSLAGASRRRRGAARTQERAAHSRVEAALEEDWSSAADIPHAGCGRGAVCRHLS